MRTKNETPRGATGGQKGVSEETARTHSSTRATPLARWGAVLELPDLDPTPRLVLLALAYHAGDGLAWPSSATLARRTGASPRTVQRALRELEDSGLIRREGYRQRCACYRLQLPDVGQIDRSQGGDVGQIDQGQDADVGQDGQGQEIQKSDVGQDGESTLANLSPTLVTVANEQDEQDLNGTTTNPPSPRAAGADRFSEFWEAYPRKAGKAEARKAWKQTCPGSESSYTSRPPLPELLAAVKSQAASDQWTKDGGRFIPHPATWLRGARWEDEVTAPAPAVRGSKLNRSTEAPHVLEDAAEVLAAWGEEGAQ